MLFFRTVHASLSLKVTLQVELQSFLTIPKHEIERTTELSIICIVANRIQPISFREVNRNETVIDLNTAYIQKVLHVIGHLKDTKRTHK